MLPSGIVWLSPWQIAGFCVDVNTGFTVRVVTMVLSQPFAAANVLVYEPAVLTTVPLGKVYVSLAQMEAATGMDWAGNTVKVSTTVLSQPRAEATVRL